MNGGGTRCAREGVGLAIEGYGLGASEGDGYIIGGGSSNIGAGSSD